MATSPEQGTSNAFDMAAQDATTPQALSTPAIDPTLQGAPAEIIFAFMEHIDSLDDLFAFREAHPAVFQLYNDLGEDSKVKDSIRYRVVASMSPRTLIAAIRLRYLTYNPVSPVNPRNEWHREDAREDAMKDVEDVGFWTREVAGLPPQVVRFIFDFCVEHKAFTYMATYRPGGNGKVLQHRPSTRGYQFPGFISPEERSQSKLRDRAYGVLFTLELVYRLFAGERKYGNDQEEVLLYQLLQSAAESTPKFAPHYTKSEIARLPGLASSATSLTAALRQASTDWKTIQLACGDQHRLDDLGVMMAFMRLARKKH